MARNEARKQKQLAKKKAKRTEKRTQIARQRSSDPGLRLQGAMHWPIVETLVPETLWSTGLGQLIISRRQPDGRLACGVLLVDVFCLGVKDAFWDILSEAEYQELLEKVGKMGTLRKTSPECFAKIVQGALDFAQALGFPPHSDFRHVSALLGGIDPAACSETFQFGMNGKPVYIRGPHDSPEKVRVVTNRIRAAGGEYLPPPPDLLTESGELLLEDGSDQDEDEFE
jgi:hypothetical protein